MDSLIETPRLRLRPLSEDDAEFILELLNQPSFLHFIGDRGVRTLDDARSYIYNKILLSYDTHGFGLYKVEQKSEPIPMGIAGFVKRAVLDYPDVGFAFLESFWARGYAYESSAAMIHHGRTRLRMDRILGVTSPTNQSSIRLLEKLGLRFERMIQLPGLAAEQKLFSTPEPETLEEVRSS